MKNPLSLILRNELINLPPIIGQKLSYIPFSMRPGIGNIYQKQKKLIQAYDESSANTKKEIIYNLFSNLVYYAYHTIPFYKSHYDINKFHPKQFKSFEYIKDIPIINKAILNNTDIIQRSNLISGSVLTNTGGSSGNTLSFYITAKMMGNEWAHMHTIWSKLGYRSQDIKLVFIGVGGDRDNPIRYDFVRNSFFVNIYSQEDIIAREIINIAQRYKIKYLHGYPSALYNFALYCQNANQKLCNILKRNLKGAFLGSEFPVPLYRDVIEKTFQIKTISWYGHTERCVLAYEKEIDFVYYPFQTYGFAEISKYNTLVGTSYYNFASPMIRYDSEDEINNPIIEGDILESFKIDGGRKGQFIIDKFGSRITLTALIFGRHHKLFDYCSHLQVRQSEKGKADILFVLKNNVKKNSLNNIEQLFDSGGCFLDFNFYEIDAPIKNKNGKADILIN